MKSNIFYNYKSHEKNLKKKILLDLSDKKVNVNINMLLNRVKIDKQNEKKYKIIFFSFGILLLIFMGLFVTIVR